MGGHHGEGNVTAPLDGDLQQSEMGGTDFGVGDGSSWDDGLGGVGGDGGSDWS